MKCGALLLRPSGRTPDAVLHPAFDFRHLSGLKREHDAYLLAGFVFDILPQAPFFP